MKMFETPWGSQSWLPPAFQPAPGRSRKRVRRQDCLPHTDSRRRHKAVPYVTFVCLTMFAIRAVAGDVALPFRYAAQTPAPVYSADSGYGFEAGDGNYFSVKVPEGNYNVTAAVTCTTTIKSESRRLMLEQTPPGTHVFTVNVRNSKVPAPPLNAPGGDQVRLNEREQGVLHWDDKLTIEFSGPRTCLQNLEIAKAEVPTIFLAGDSTVTDQPLEPTTSWGQMLPRFFRPGIAVANHAESGETLKSFITGLRLADAILSEARAHLPIPSAPGTELTELTSQLQASDATLNFARSQFNAAVQAYNRGVKQFPTLLLVGLFGFRVAGTL